MIGTKEYFSEWFDIIPKSDAKMLFQNGNGSFYILANDGSERYADCFNSWEEIEQSFPDALFGFDKVVENKNIYGVYAEKQDITFIMEDTFDGDGEIKSTEVIGFVYGNEENNIEVLKEYSGNLKAEF